MAPSQNAQNGSEWPLDPDGSDIGDTPSDDSGGNLGPHFRYRRNIFTGQLEKVPSEGGGRQIIYRGSTPKHYNPNRVGMTTNYDRVVKGLSLKPEDATPERVEAENESARKHGTGAWFDANGECHTSTRGCQNREMRRQSIRNQELPVRMPGLINLDAGYHDYAG